MRHTSWCVYPNHAVGDGCTSESSIVGDLGYWLHADPSTDPVVMLDPNPMSNGLTLDVVCKLARRLDELALAMREGGRGADVCTMCAPHVHRSA
jgi:hypothetical protein